VAASEIEWQFDAVDLDAVARWLGDEADVGDVTVVPAETTSLVDLYVDTEDQRFHRAGYSLRIRRVGRRREAEAMLKSLEQAASGEPGLRRRAPYGATKRLASIPMSIRVVLGEDSYLAREGIMRVLEGLDEVDIVATCGDLDELRRASGKLGPPRRR